MNTEFYCLTCHTTRTSVASEDVTPEQGLPHTTADCPVCGDGMIGHALPTDEA